MTKEEYEAAVKNIRNLPIDELIDLKIFEDEHNFKIDYARQENERTRLSRIEAKLDEIIRLLVEDGK